MTTEKRIRIFFITLILLETTSYGQIKVHSMRVLLYKLNYTENTGQRLSSYAMLPLFPDYNPAETL